MHLPALHALCTQVVVEGSAFPKMTPRENLQLILGGSDESKNATTLESTEHAQTPPEDELVDGSHDNPPAVQDLYPTTPIRDISSVPTSIPTDKNNDIYLVGELCRITCG